MSSQTAAVTFKNIDYKCDCEKDGDTYKSCAWGEISEKENELKLLCTVNLVGEASNDYVCMNADAGHDWRTVTAEEWCPTHGKNLTGGDGYHGICDDVPGDNTTYLLIGSASSWAQVPNTYRWNDDNITTADKKAVEAQLISGNSCTDKDIVSLLYDYTIKGTTDRVHDFICKDGKLRVANDEQDACGAAYETTVLCKYMKNWYMYDNGTWRKPTCDDVPPFDATDHFCDGRDDGSVTVYRMVKIGEGEKEQTWMAENLNYETENSYCYNDDPANCIKKGRLYTWAAAMDSVGSWSTNGKGCGYGKTCSPTYPVRGVCPDGWHLPDTTEWNTLFNAVGGKSVAGTKLKSTSGWYNSGNGTDAFSFSALPAGGRSPGGLLYYNGSAAVNFWSSTEENGTLAYYMYLYYNKVNADLDHTYKYSAFSVRCIKDPETVSQP
jgi:uncharacterized protein (TIGR02145 family)